MSPHQIDVLVLASLVSLACALPGVFLVLRKVALMSDAISHAILFGIVVAFFVVKNLNSPLLVFGAAITGVLTVVLTELLINSGKLKKDAAIGLVFPLLFSLGVILLTRYAGDVHLDTQCVLFGEIAFAPFTRLVAGGRDWGPLATWVIAGVLAMNIVFIVAFYKELKLTTFDPGLAAALGFYPAVINYIFMTLISVTAVGAFESVGSILVVALMIAPPAAAYLLTDRLSHMLFVSAGMGVLSAISGYFMAQWLDASIAGSMATMSGVLFFLAFIFAPSRGIVAPSVVRKYEKWNFASETLAVHLLQAEQAHAEESESVVKHMNEHMLWNDEYTSEAIAQGLKDGLLKRDGNRLSLTKLGREKAKNSLSRD
ncbi:MAG: metal ABC transporter permease [Candidatus Omnitrophica bacterium]|nr:metal ABC transporter permease [Candidatus Omnitrophota bacterium]